MDIKLEGLRLYTNKRTGQVSIILPKRDKAFKKFYKKGYTHINILMWNCKYPIPRPYKVETTIK